MTTVIATGFTKMFGTAKESGRAYDMAQLHILLPNSEIQTAVCTKQGVGLVGTEYPVDPSAAYRFLALDFTDRLYLLELEKRTELRAGRRGAEEFTTCVGFRVLGVLPIASSRFTSSEKSSSSAPSPAAEPKASAAN